MEKLCLFCPHLDYESKDLFGSTWTGQYGEAGFDCNKNHFGKQKPDDLEELRALFLKAETCADYRKGE